MPLRVVQWTTGNVGRRALRAIAAHPALELAGVFAHGSDKAGRDAGELCGGSPRVRTRLQILPPHGFTGKSFEDFMVLGMIATALPAVHAIPAVCAARPGIVSYAELPLVTAAHCLR